MQKFNLLYSVFLSCAFFGPLQIGTLQGASYHSIQEAVASDNWGSVLRLGSEKIQSKKTTVKKIGELAKLLKSDDLLRIVKGTKSLIKLQNQTQMSDVDCFALATFIEKKLPQMPQGPQEYDCFKLLDEKNSVLKKGYYSPERTKLKYPIQFVDGYDLQEMLSTRTLQYIVKRKVFIHLNNKKAIYYKPKKSILMGSRIAQSTSELEAIRGFGNEIDACQYVRVDAEGNKKKDEIADHLKLRRMISYVALLDLPNDKKLDSSNTAKAVVSPIYTDITLDTLLKSNLKLSTKEKVKIFKDIVETLSVIHAHNCANRDLDMRNWYVKIRKHKKSQSVSALIGNLHAIHSCAECAKYPIQQNRRYLPPEAYQNSVFHSHIAIQASDIFAAGCIGWRLLFGKEVPWAEKEINEPTDARYKNYLNQLLPQLAWMQMKVSREPKSTQSRFMKILVAMLSHNPYDRKTAKQLLEELEIFYERL